MKLTLIFLGIMMGSTVSAEPIQKLALFGEQADPDPSGRGNGFPQIEATLTEFCTANCGFLSSNAYPNTNTQIKSISEVEAESGFTAEWSTAFLSGDHPWGTLCLSSEFPTPLSGNRCTNSWINYRPSDLSVYTNGWFPSIRYRVSFYVPSFPTDENGEALDASMLVKMKVDNWGKAWINGEEIPGFLWGSAYLNGSAEFARSVKPGINTIELVVGDGGGLAGFTYLIELKMQADAPLGAIPVGGPVDTDGDGVPDENDAFPNNPNETTDSDQDGIGDNSDNCVNLANVNQADFDGDGNGDVCDTDVDGDGVDNESDICSSTQSDTAGISDLKNNHFSDLDGDGVFDSHPRSKKSFTLIDTFGCGCDQIIIALGLGEGHEKHGCSGGVIGSFIKMQEL